jgi:phosphoglucomutase/phosphomannomutase
VKILYSPLHGVGQTAVCPVLAADGFHQVELFGPHAEPDGDFPNVPGHVANPENAAVFDAIIAEAARLGADLALATDPDADRIGCAAPLAADRNSGWAVLSGNQIGALLADFLLAARRSAGPLNNGQYVVKTLVTTELIRRIADGYGAAVRGDLLVGFKWIGGVIDEMGPEGFLFGAEESHGYLVGSYARDKDASVAAMLLAELAARLKADGLTLCQELDRLFLQHGVHAEKTVSIAMPGAEGMQRQAELMGRLRQAPPAALAGIPVVRLRDYLGQQAVVPGRQPEPLAGPRGDLVILDLAEEGNCVAVRPSGTEPKVKFYMFAFDRAGSAAELAERKAQLAERIAAMEADVAALAEA